MAADQVQVVNTWLSAFGMRVFIALKEKGVAYEVIEEDLQNKSKVLLDSNPVYKMIPVLIHNGKPICESSIIVQYIDEAWPSATASFLPENPCARANARFWVDFIDKKVYDAGARIIRSPEGEKREQARKDMAEAMQTLEKAFAEVFGGGPFFGGQHIGYVDINFAPYLCWFEAYESSGELRKCPGLSKWAEAVMQVPSVRDALSMAPSHKVAEAVLLIRKRYLDA